MADLSPRPCSRGCGRKTRHPSGHCAPCRRASAEGYHLSPAPSALERSAPGREEAIERYARRAALGLPLFGEGEG